MNPILGRHLAAAQIVVSIASGAVGVVIGFLFRHLSHPAASVPNNASRASEAPTHPSVSTGGGLPEATEKPGMPPDFMLGIVNVIDQIELSKAHAGADSLPTLTGIQASLRDQVELAGGEVIQETVWNPAVQRAVKVETASAGQIETLFLRSLSTGLKFRSRIVRKQEVAISQPSHSP